MLEHPLCNIRLATTEAGLAKGYLMHSWQLPAPALPVYADHSVKVALANGGQAIRGFRSFSLTWDRLTDHQANVLRALVEAALDTANEVIFATIDFGWDGTQAPGYFVDVSGEPHIMDNTPAGNTWGRARDGVTLFVNNLTDVNNPASF